MISRNFIVKMRKHFMNTKPNFYSTRCISPKRVTSWRCPFPRHSAKAAQLPA